MKQLSILLLLLPIFANAQIINMYAGNGMPGYTGDGGAATAATLTGPHMARADKAGNVFIADLFNHCIRKVDAAGTITTVAGSGSSTHSGDGGPATAAGVYEPKSVAIDNSGNFYFPEGPHFAAASYLRKVNTSGIISTIAGTGVYGYTGDGGPATAADIRDISDLVVDKAGNVYIVDDASSVVRKIDAAGIITTIVGTGVSTFSGDGGPATAAGLNALAIAIDTGGNLYIADYNNYRIRKVNTLGIITTVAGNGTSAYSADGVPATATGFTPQSVAIDKYGNIYISDEANARVRKVDNAGIITTIAGTGTPGHTGDGGPATAAELWQPFGVDADAVGSIYISDPNSNYVRKIAAPATIASFTVSGDTICQDSCLTFINTSTGYIDSIKWMVYGDTTMHPGKDTITACFPSSGIDSVKLYVYTGWLTDSVVHNVMVKRAPHPILIDTLLCGVYVPDIYNSYNWYVCDFWGGGGTPFAIGDTTYYTLTTLSKNAYVIVDSNGCKGRSDTVARCVESVEKITNQAATLRIFPNPAYTELTVVYSKDITSIIITNSVGQTVYTDYHTNRELHINVANLNTGIYFVKINGAEVRKFVKE